MPNLHASVGQDGASPEALPTVVSTVAEVLAPTVAKIDQALAKEGAGLELKVDETAGTIVAILVRHRITCEGCLLPKELVETMLRKSLKVNRETRELNYAIKTVNWLS
jgi:hypothetical protein